MTWPLAVGIGMWLAGGQIGDYTRPKWNGAGWQTPSPFVVPTILSVGALLGIPLWLLFARACEWSAMGNGTPAPRSAVRTACAWGAFPAVFCGPIYLAADVYRWHGPVAMQEAISGVALVAVLVLTLWAIRGLAKGIGGVCNVSDYQALGILFGALLSLMLLSGAVALAWHIVVTFLI